MVEPVNKPQIFVEDVIKFDSPDPELMKYFDPKIYSVAQQIIHQREFLNIASKVSMQLNEGESIEDILKRMSSI